MTASARHIELSPIRAVAGVMAGRDRCILDLIERPRTLAEPVEASPINGGRAFAPGVLDSWEGQTIGKHLGRLQRQVVRRDGPADGPPCEAGADRKDHATPASPFARSEDDRQVRRSRRLTS